MLVWHCQWYLNVFLFIVMVLHLREKGPVTPRGLSLAVLFKKPLGETPVEATHNKQIEGRGAFSKWWET